MFKKMIADIKENWLADLMFVTSGALAGLLIKFIVGKLQLLELFF